MVIAGRWHGRGTVQAIDLASTSERTAVRQRRVLSALEFPSRLLGALVTKWPLQASSSRVPDWLGEGPVVASRLYLPVSLLTATLFAIFVCLDRSFPYLSDGGSWLKWSHVLIAFAFLLTQLTNRRYGPGYAFAQIILSLAICDVVVVVRPAGIVNLLRAEALPNAREVVAFVGAFIAAGYLSVVAFDATRGPRWWTAPLIGSYVSSLGFAVLYYPLAYAGSGSSWFQHMSTHAGILIAASVIGLLPYWLLRPVIRPLPGFGGY